MSDNINKNTPASPEEENEITTPVADNTESSAEEISSDTDEFSSIFDAPQKKLTKEEEDQKRGKKKRFSKQTGIILTAFIVCLALVGGIFAINSFIEKPDDTSSASNSEEVTYIYDYSSYVSSSADTEYLNLGGVKQVSVKNKSTEYIAVPETVIKTTTDESTGETTTKESLKWDISEVAGMDIEGIRFSSSTLIYILSDALKPAYFGVYAEDVNATIPEGTMTYFEECGFNDPEAKYDIAFADGSTITLYVGNLTPTQDGYLVYADCRPNMDTVESVTADGETIPILGRPEVDTKVYKCTEDAVSFLLKDLNTVVDRQIIEEFTTDENDPYNSYYADGTLIKFDSISLYSKAIGKTINFSCIDANTPATSNIYLVNSPENFNPNTEHVDSLLSPLASGLRANGCYEARATDENKKKYGFDDPLARVIYRVGNKTVGLTIAKGVEVDYYAVMSDDDVSIYKIEDGKATFVDIALNDWRNPLMYANYITNVESIEMRVKNSSGNISATTFNLEHFEDDGTNETLAVTTSDGQTINTDAFRDMYSSIISTTIEGEYVTDGVESNSPAIQVTVRYAGYEGYDVLKYSDYSARRYYFTLNGRNGAPVRSTLVDEIGEKYFALFE